jgi:uncharacterized protein
MVKTIGLVAVVFKVQKLAWPNKQSISRSKFFKDLIMRTTFYSMFRFFFLILFFFNLSQAGAASFDCAKAGTPFEKTICSNPNLSSLDDRVAQLYGAAKASSTNPDQLKAEQINWIKEARTCGTDVLCIEVAYRKRAIALTPLPMATSPLPQAAPTTPTATQLTCSDTSAYMQMPNGNKKDLGVEGSKPYIVKVNQNILQSYYPNGGPNTVANGARYSKTEESVYKGDSIAEVVYDKPQDADGMKGRFTIIKNKTKNTTSFMMQTLMSGTLMVNVANCK